MYLPIVTQEQEVRQFNPTRGMSEQEYDAWQLKALGLLTPTESSVMKMKSSMHLPRMLVGGIVIWEQMIFCD
jgi:hypothetical protein